MQTAEHKVPDGKLLRVDIDAGETIDHIRLHGDFFIYPETARHDIEAAVTGAPADAPAETLSDLIRDGMSPDTELVGFSPDDVATVITEAMRDE